MNTNDAATVAADCDKAAAFYEEKPGMAGAQTDIDLYRAIARLARIIEKQRGLLLATARLLRAHLADVIKESELAQDDLASLQEALAPFEPDGGEPVNEANRPEYNGADTPPI